MAQINSYQKERKQIINLNEIVETYEILKT